MAWVLVALIVALPGGFTVGWLMGHHELVQRCNEDERAGRCGRCGNTL